ncbi:STAS domain-containing protein [Thalassovita aquimarina]|uniref:Anti-sigma factor antagonist n=1 Tax=Thalassovita aquimarina TaxID=2785917 RepID=A0ABS5HMM0_9RHOB|nr:STAS domain-containing protein [Thalassovita aquimarina]MBR9650214.1 STAS domain-containing protein [Thalassovita aquimarina]
MQIISNNFGDTQVVSVEENRIDAAVVIAFKDRMRALTDGDTTHVILDLSRVNFIDSSGLGAIVAAMKQLGRGRVMHLAGLQPNVDKVFRLTRMDTIFRIHDSVDQALAAATG